MSYVNENIINNINDIMRRIDQASFFQFKNLRKNDLSDRSGVYLISLIVDGTVLYVGKTKNFRQRLYTNHLMGNHSTARLKKYLVEDKSLSEISSYKLAKQYLINNCQFKCIEVNDFIELARIEGLCSYLYSVKYIDTCN